MTWLREWIDELRWRWLFSRPASQRYFAEMAEKIRKERERGCY